MSELKVRITVEAIRDESVVGQAVEEIKVREKGRVGWSKFVDETEVAAGELTSKAMYETWKEIEKH